MGDIFISYANEDRTRAKMFAMAFEEHGWSVFWDRTIPIGRTWRETVGAALRNTQCVVVLWSKASIESNWVHEEADDARRRGILAPVRIENVEPPIGFRSIQTADLLNWNARKPTLAFNRLVTDIALLIGSHSKEAQREVKLKPPRSTAPKEDEQLDRRDRLKTPSIQGAAIQREKAGEPYSTPKGGLRLKPVGANVAGAA